MVSKLIDVFAKKFNKMARRTSAYNYNLIYDEDSVIGMLSFDGFCVEFDYSLECGGEVEKSGLGIIIDLSQKYSETFKCMMYDIMPYVDDRDFTCWYYCFVENTERMELCFDKLENDFFAIFPKLQKALNDEQVLEKLEKQVDESVKITVGAAAYNDMEEELQSDRTNIAKGQADLAKALVMGLYIGNEQCAYASKAYCAFIEGDYKKALKRYSRKKYLLLYEKNLVEYMKSCREPKPLFDEKYFCLKEGLREYYGSTGFVPFAVSALMMFFPVLFVCLTVYFAVCGIMYHNTLYSSAFEWYNGLYCVMPAFIGSMVMGYISRDTVYRRLFKKRYKRMKDYEAIFNSGKTKKRMKTFLYLVYVIILLFVFLSANNALVLTDNGVSVTGHYFDIVKDNYSYNNIDGVYIDGESCIMYAKGNEIHLSNFVEFDDTEKQILPILRENKVRIISSTDGE